MTQAKVFLFQFISNQFDLTLKYFPLYGYMYCVLLYMKFNKFARTTNLSMFEKLKIILSEQTCQNY